jgi:hypothetical protein
MSNNDTNSNDSSKPTPPPVHHSDNESSKMPERDDHGRDQAPHDNPGKKPGEGEAPVG